MLGEDPVVALEIDGAVAAVAVELVRRLFQDGRAGGAGLGEVGVHIVDVDHHLAVESGQVLRAGLAHLGECGGQHQDIVAQVQLSVAEHAFAHLHLHAGLKAERGGEEFDCRRGVGVAQVGDDPLVAFGGILDHGAPLSFGLSLRLALRMF